MSKSISFHPYTVHHKSFDLVIGKHEIPTIIFKTKEQDTINSVEDYVRESYKSFYIKYME